MNIKLQKIRISIIPSLRLRVALALMILFGWFSLFQTSLLTWQSVVVALAMMAVFIKAWRDTCNLPNGMVFSFRPLRAEVISTDGAMTSVTCARLSVYPWLIVLHIRDDAQQRRVVVLLSDSLPDRSIDQWRQLLIWAKLMRRQIAMR